MGSAISPSRISAFSFAMLSRLLLALIFGFAVAAPAAHIVIMAVEEPDNCDAINSMRRFAERERGADRQTLTEVVQPDADRDQQRQHPHHKSPGGGNKN